MTSVREVDFAVLNWQPGQRWRPENQRLWTIVFDAWQPGQISTS